MCERCHELRQEVGDLRRQLALETDLTLADELSRAFHLRPQCGRILATLYQTRGRIVSKGVLYDRLYDHEQDGDPKIIDVLVSQLRKAIGHELIGTVWGRGVALTVAGVEIVEARLAAQKAAA